MWVKFRNLGGNIKCVNNNTFIIKFIYCLKQQKVLSKYQIKVAEKRKDKKKTTV